MKILHFLLNARQTILLAWKLVWDPKVPAALKFLLPVLAIIYWISPIDLMPFLPFDDIVVVGIALKLFVELAQPRDLNQAGSSSGGHSASDLETGAIPTTWVVMEDGMEDGVEDDAESDDIPGA